MRRIGSLERDTGLGDHRTPLRSFALDVGAKLNAACQKALNLPVVKQRLAELSVEPAPTSADEFGAYIKSETAKWRTVITEAGISLK